MHRAATVRSDKHQMCMHCSSTFIIGVTHVSMYIKYLYIYIMMTVCCAREMHWRNRDSIYYVCMCECVQATGRNK